MAWDSTRPVPWQRLMREWVVYASIMTVVLLLFFRDAALGAVIGVLISGPLYLGLGAVLAKFGYQRATLRSMRTPRPSTVSTTAPGDSGRTRPAPTRRTTTGPNRKRRT